MTGWLLVITILHGPNAGQVEVGHFVTRAFCIEAALAIGGRISAQNGGHPVLAECTPQAGAGV